MARSCTETETATSHTGFASYSAPSSQLPRNHAMPKPVSKMPKPVLRMAAEHDVELTLRDEDNEYYRPASLTSDGYRYIKKTVEAAFPYAAATPFILPAGTDARQFTELSDAVIRFAPIDIDKQQYASVHRPKRALTGTVGERSL